jgi:hypothetical protein
MLPRGIFHSKTIISAGGLLQRIGLTVCGLLQKIMLSVGVLLLKVKLTVCDLLKTTRLIVGDLLQRIMLSVGVLLLRIKLTVGRLLRRIELSVGAPASCISLVFASHNLQHTTNKGMNRIKLQALVGAGGSVPTCRLVSRACNLTYYPKR